MECPRTPERSAPKLFGKTKTEFRVFLPLLVDSDAAWMPNEVREAYATAVERVMEHFQNDIAVAEGPRVDEYLVLDHSNGVKIREGERELKTRERRQKSSGLFFEDWNKRDGEVSVEELVDHVSRIPGADITINRDEGDVKDAIVGRWVAVEKRRTKDKMKKYARETCFLSSRDRAWLSLAAESKVENLDRIRDYLLDENKTPRLYWQAVRQAERIASVVNGAREASFVPMVGGYPAWVRLVDLAASAEEFAEAVRDVNALLTQLSH